MIPKKISIATEKSRLVEPEPPCTCEPIQTQPNGTPKPTTAATTIVAISTPIPRLGA